MCVFVIAVIILGLMGVGCCFAPQFFTKSNQRNVPESVARVKKLGPMLIVYSVGAVLLALKFKS